MTNFFRTVPSTNLSEEYKTVGAAARFTSSSSMDEQMEASYGESTNALRTHVTSVLDSADDELEKERQKNAAAMRTQTMRQLDSLPQPKMEVPDYESRGEQSPGTSASIRQTVQSTPLSVPERPRLAAAFANDPDATGLAPAEYEEPAPLAPVGPVGRSVQSVLRAATASTEKTFAPIVKGVQESSQGIAGLAGNVLPQGAANVVGGIGGALSVPGEVYKAATRNVLEGAPQSVVDVTGEVASVMAPTGLKGDVFGKLNRARLAASGVGAAAGAGLGAALGDPNSPGGRVGEAVKGAAMGFQVGAPGLDLAQGAGRVLRRGAGAVADVADTVAGAVGREGAEAPVFGIVPPGVARTLGDVRLPEGQALRDAIANTPDVSLGDDGLRLNVSRWQRAEAANTPAGIGGVFYSPVRNDAYRATDAARLGGNDLIQGETLLRRPYVMVGGNSIEGLRRLAGEAGYSPDEASELVSDALYASRRGALNEYNTIVRNAGLDPLPGTFDASQPGASLSMEESLRAALARRAGYDSVVRVSNDAQGRRAISEVMDLREATYPTPDGGYSLRPEFQPKAEAPVLGIRAGDDGITAGRRVYHGTGTTFATPDPSKFDPNGLYGPGYYLTDEPRVASSYAATRVGEANADKTAAWLAQDVAVARRGLAEELAGARNAEEIAAWQDQLDDVERALREHEVRNPQVGSAQVRPVEIPESARLLDADAELTDTRLITLANETLSSPLAPGATGTDLFERLRRALGDPAAVNRALRSVGYDGIKYAGGQRMPLLDDAGKEIAHNAYVIFPESLPKITNALTGQPGGIVAGTQGRYRGGALGNMVGEAIEASANSGLGRGVQNVTRAEAGQNLSVGAIGGVANAASGPEDSTWQERAERGLSGFVVGAAGAHAARGGLGQARRLGAVAGDAAESITGVPLSEQGKLARENAIANTMKGSSFDRAAAEVAVDRKLWKLHLADQLPPEYRSAALADPAPAAEESAIALREMIDAADEPPAPELVEALKETPAGRVGGVLRDNLKRPTMDETLARFMNNMLSSPRTQMVNMSSAAQETAVRPTLALLEGRPVEAMKDVLAMGRGVGSAWHEAAKAFVEGGEAMRAGSMAAEGPEAAARPEAFAGKWGMAHIPLLRLMGASDRFFKTTNMAGAAAAAQRRGLTGKAADDFVLNAGNQAVFEGESGRVVKTVIAARNLIHEKKASDRAIGVIAHILFPFVKIPSAIASRGIKMTLSPVTDLVATGRALKKGDTEAARSANARWLLNTGLAVAIGSNIHGGNITGMGPRDYREREILEAARDENGNPVWQAHSIRIGNGWFDYSALGPVGIQMALMASAYDAWKEADEKPSKDWIELWQKRLGSFASRMAQTTIDQSYLKSAADTVKLLNAGRAAEVPGKVLTNTLSRAVPYSGLLNTLAKAGDVTRKEPRNVGESLMTRIPGLTDLVPDKIDPTTGEGVQAPQDIVSLLSPWKASAKGKPNPVAAEVARLERANIPIGIRQFDKNVEYEGERQTPEQRRVLQAAFGKLTNQYIREQIDKPTYKTATDEVKAATLNKALQTAYGVADRDVGNQVTRTPAGKADLEYQSIPHYDGVEGTPEEIRRQNYEIDRARARLSELTAQYRDKGGAKAAQFALYEESPELYDLATRKEVPKKWLDYYKEEIYKKHSAESNPASKALPGSGNVPVTAAARLVEVGR